MGAYGIEANQDIARKQSNLLTHPASLHPYFHPPRSAHNKLPASISIWHSSDTVCAHLSRKLSHDTRSLVPQIGEWTRAEVWGRNHHNGQTDK